MKKQDSDLPVGSYLASLVAVYEQEPDSCQSGHHPQRMEISLEDAGSGPYMILKTDRWAIDNVGEMVSLVESFQQKYLQDKPSEDEPKAETPSFPREPIPNTTGFSTEKDEPRIDNRIIEFVDFEIKRNNRITTESKPLYTPAQRRVAEKNLETLIKFKSYLLFRR